VIRVETASSLRGDADRLLDLAAEVARARLIPRLANDDRGILEATDDELADYVADWVPRRRAATFPLWLPSAG
jgi:hypothetical protein